MTFTQVVKTSVNVISNSPSQDYTHPVNLTLLNYEGNNITCIISDESRNFYNDVQTASTEEEFSNLKSQAASVVYDYVDEKVDQASSSVSSYKVIHK